MFVAPEMRRVFYRTPMYHIPRNIYTMPFDSFVSLACLIFPKLFGDKPEGADRKTSF